MANDAAIVDGVIHLNLPVFSISREEADVHFEPKPFPTMNPFAYQTGKAPLNIMTKSWGINFDEMNLQVQIFAAMPGAVSTDLNNHVTGKGVGMPEEAAEWIVGLALDEENHNGQVINVDGRLADYKNLI